MSKHRIHFDKHCKGHVSPFYHAADYEQYTKTVRKRAGEKIHKDSRKADKRARRRARPDKF